MSEKQNPPCPFEKLFPSQLQVDDTFYMKLAYNQAIDGWKAGEVPVGAVIVIGGEVVGSAHNEVERSQDPTAHAEMLAITQAANAMEHWRLNHAELYVTKEPCPMCSGASIMARLKAVCYAIEDPGMGCMGGAAALHEIGSLNHRVTVRSGILEAPCRELIQTFFQLKRGELT